MINKIVASTAILATTALAQSAGSAIVINQCNYPVWVTNVPASGGGQSQIGPNTLQTGQSYSQSYTELSNGDGWSIKLSKSSSLDQIMQYEYTFHNDGIIWYDLSDVNGDPWEGDWTFTATGDCTPKQTAYQYSTDDAYGMQACPDTSSVTVTLCGTGSGGTSSGGGSWGSSPAASPPASAPTSAAPAPSSPSAPYIPSIASIAPWNPAASGGSFGEKAAAPAAPESSTLATVVQNAAQTVTNMHTVVVTEYVTASPVPAPAKRHEHLHRHMAHHQHF